MNNKFILNYLKYILKIKMASFNENNTNSIKETILSKEESVRSIVFKKNISAEEEEKQDEEEPDEEDEELSMEEREKELEEMEIDRISNGECPKISHELYLSRLTSEQREVEKENHRLWKIRLKEISIQHEKQAKQEEVEEASLSDADVQQGKHSNTDLVKLCVNMDCEQYPSDWDSEEDTEETYQEGQWKKCCLCDGYFYDDGMGDILYVQEEPNNQEAECDLCGKTEDIVQMKGSGQYLCGNACDESDEDDE